MRQHILLIESDLDLHDAVVGFLENKGHLVTACWSEAEAAKAMARIPDRTRAPEVMVSTAASMGFYLAMRRRFPGMRWVLTTGGVPEETVAEGKSDRDVIPYDATIDQPEVSFPELR